MYKFCLVMPATGFGRITLERTSLLSRMAKIVIVSHSSASNES